MRVKRLTEDGLDVFRRYLTAAKTEGGLAPQEELVASPQFALPLEQVCTVDRYGFETKYELASHLVERLKPVGDRDLRRDPSIWAWLTVFYFDILCPENGKGQRSVKKTELYLPGSGDYRRGPDKHLLFFPWKMVALHGEDARFLFMSDVGADTTEQREWTGYNLNLSRPLLQLCRRLYWDETRCSFKRGAKSRHRKGALRRFVQVSRQLEVTYDIYGAPPSVLEALLPDEEFSAWLRRSP